MPKSPRANATRKPPVAGSHADIADWLQQAMLALQPLVKHLDALIRETLPDLEYAVKWKKAYYGTPELGWIIEMVAYDVSTNLVFFAGAEFDEPPPLGEGSRYVKLRTLEEARAPEVRKWIEEAGRRPGWK